MECDAEDFEDSRKFFEEYADKFRNTE